MEEKNHIDYLMMFWTAAAACVSAVMVVMTYLVLRESKKSSLRQIGVQTWMEMQKRFDSKEMEAARRSLANTWLARPASDEIQETVLNFFQDVGTLHRHGYIDKKLTKSSFSHYAARWWKASSEYVYKIRREENNSNYYRDFKTFAHEMTDERDDLSPEKIRQFLKEEATLPPGH